MSARDQDVVRARLSRALALLALLFVVATVGYRRLMHWSWLQALFFTVISVTTVGYHDYQLSDDAKVFTIAVLLVGLALWTLVLAHLVESVMLGWQRRRQRQMERDLDALSAHFIVVGYGLVGRNVAAWLREARRRVVVVDLDPAAVDAARAAQLTAVEGDATVEATLRQLGLERAAGLMAVTRSDPVNVFVTLTARGLRPELHICAAAMNPGSEAKLRRAGADAVVSPYELGAQRLAQAAVSPSVAELMAGYGDGPECGLLLREAVVEPGSLVAGCSLREANLPQATGVLVAAVKRAVGGQLEISPGADYVAQPGDVLIGLGQRDELAEFCKRVAPLAAQQLAGLA